MVDRAGLENRRSESFRGFESHPLRICEADQKVNRGDENDVRLPARKRKANKGEAPQMAEPAEGRIIPPPPNLRSRSKSIMFTRF